MHQPMDQSKEIFDVVIVGAGGSGLTAAIHAKLNGSSVIVLEKSSTPGGTTAWSVGSFTASQTPHQKKLGIEDRPDWHFEDMNHFNQGKGDFDHLELRRLFVEHASETLQWLMSIGIVFDGPYPESHHRQPRMHNVIPNSGSFTHHLRAECKRLNIPILTHCKVTELIKDQVRVVGVKAQTVDERERTFMANQGVLLAAGDFAAGLELKRQFLGPLIAKAASVNPDATGDGIVLGLSNQGRVVNGGHASALKMRFIPAGRNLIQSIPPHQWLAKSLVWALNHLPKALIRPFVMKFITTVLGPEPTLFKCGAILVDDSGQLVSLPDGQHAKCLIETPNNTGFIIFNAETAQHLNDWPNFISTAPGLAYAYLKDYENARKDICKKAKTLEQLARLIGVQPERLMQAAANISPSKAFYAMGPVRGFVTITEGGLAINSRFQVLDKNDQPIAGLFAAGSNGQGGLLLEGHGHHIGWAFVSGRLAGQSISTQCL
jgi:fumarate reductase flavoprotein subunit